MSEEKDTESSGNQGKSNPKNLPNNEKNGKDSASEHLSSKPISSSPSSADRQCDWSPHNDFDDFMRKLTSWTWECQQWKNFHSNYQTILSQMAGNNAASNTNTSTPNANNFFAGWRNLQAARAPESRTGPGAIYKIPPLWKRIAAEFIDCVLLLMLKLVLLSAIVSEFIQIDQLEEFRNALLEDDNLKALNEVMFEFSAEMLGFAILHRVIVCIYETYSLYRYPNANPNVGGATIGKMMLRLRVVSCQTIDDLGDGRVRIWPAGNIGFTNSLGRAVIKNSSIVFFLPLVFAVLGSQYNRTAYDFMCSCVVVEAADSTDRRRPAPR